MEPNTVIPYAAEPIAPSALTPLVPRAVVRRLIVGVIWANVALALIATGVVVIAGRADWWSPLAASVVIAAMCAIASVLILSSAAGRTVDWLVTFVMATAGVRVFVSLMGLIVAVKAFHTPDELTGLGVVCFYVVTLVVETTLLTRALAASAGDKHA